MECFWAGLARRDVLAEASNVIRAGIPSPAAQLIRGVPSATISSGGDYGDPIGQVLRSPRPCWCVVRNTVLPQRAQAVDHALHAARRADRVEAGSGLVEEDQLGIADQGQGQVEPGRRCPPESCSPSVSAFCSKPGQLDRLVDRARRRRVVASAIELQVLAHGPDPAPGATPAARCRRGCAACRPRPRAGSTPSTDTSPSLRLEALEDLHRGLSCLAAVRAEEREDLARDGLRDRYPPPPPRTRSAYASRARRSPASSRASTPLTSSQGRGLRSTRPDDLGCGRSRGRARAAFGSRRSKASPAAALGHRQVAVPSCGSAGTTYQGRPAGRGSFAAHLRRPP